MRPAAAVNCSSVSVQEGPAARLEHDYPEFVLTDSIIN